MRRLPCLLLLGLCACHKHHPARQVSITDTTELRFTANGTSFDWARVYAVQGDDTLTPPIAFLGAVAPGDAPGQSAYVLSSADVEVPNGNGLGGYIAFLFLNSVALLPWPGAPLLTTPTRPGISRAWPTCWGAHGQSCSRIR